jgi:molybdopterin converting factor small subunit
MHVSVEFFGIARLWAGVGHVEVELAAGKACLTDILDSLAERLPAFRQSCLAGGRLDAALICNIDGQRFITDPATPIADRQTVLILSADAGG